MKDITIAVSVLVVVFALVLISAVTGGMVLHLGGLSLATCYRFPFTTLAVGLPIVLASCAALIAAAFFCSRRVAVFLKKIYAGIPV